MKIPSIRLMYGQAAFAVTHPLTSIQKSFRFAKEQLRDPGKRKIFLIVIAGKAFVWSCYGGAWALREHKELAATVALTGLVSGQFIGFAKIPLYIAGFMAARAWAKRSPIFNPALRKTSKPPEL